MKRVRRLAAVALWIAGLAWLTGCGGGGGAVGGMASLLPGSGGTGAPSGFQPPAPSPVGAVTATAAPEEQINPDPAAAGAGSTSLTEPVLPPTAAGQPPTEAGAVISEPADAGVATGPTPSTGNTGTATQPSGGGAPGGPTPSTGNTGTGTTGSTGTTGGAGSADPGAGPGDSVDGTSGGAPAPVGGGDTAPPDTGMAGSNTWSGLERSLADRPDDVTGPQVHFIYAVPSDLQDRRLDLTNNFQYSVLAMNRWLGTQIGQQLRLDTWQGRVDITFVRLPRTDAEYLARGPLKRVAIEADLRESNLLSTEKIYYVYYDGSNDLACADAPFVTRRDAVQDRVAVFYLRGVVPGYWPCGANPMASTPDAPTLTWFDITALHEILHTLGVQHVEDPCDVMRGNTQPCATDWAIDPGRDDYLFTGSTSAPPSSRTDIAQSPYLTPRTASTTTPTGSTASTGSTSPTDPAAPTGSNNSTNTGSTAPVAGSASSGAAAPS